MKQNLTNHTLKDCGEKMQFIKEMWEFLKTRKKWWLLPTLLVLLTFGSVIVFTSGSALAPFIYTLF